MAPELSATPLRIPYQGTTITTRIVVPPFMFIGGAIAEYHLLLR